MKLVDHLINNTKGNSYETRKQHLDSMDRLSKEGFKYMEIRVTDLSKEDLQYFMDQGLEAELFDNGDYPYYKIIWEREFSPEITQIATGYAVGFTLLEGLWKILSIPLVFSFKFFGLFL